MVVVGDSAHWGHQCGIGQRVTIDGMQGHEGYRCVTADGSHWYIADADVIQEVTDEEMQEVYRSLGVDKSS